MAIGFRAIIEALESSALTLGVFDRVGRHEPENAPGRGITSSFWAGPGRPFKEHSGLDATSVLQVINQRLVTTMTSQPADDIDVNLMDALDVQVGAYNAGFTLGGLISHIDILGRSRIEMLRWETGYVEQDSQQFRMYQIFIPCVINDVWTQGA